MSPRPEHPTRGRRPRWVAVVIAGGLLAASAPAEAQSTGRIDPKRRKVVFEGHLEGGAVYGPLKLIRTDPADPTEETCVGDGCEEHVLELRVPRGNIAYLTWEVETREPAVGPDLRIVDGEGVNVARRRETSGTGTTTATRGEADRIPPGTYTIRASVQAGSADYRAVIRLDWYGPPRPRD